MTNIQAARRAAQEIQKQAGWLERQLGIIEAAEQVEPALTVRDGAKLYLRLDKLSIRLGDLADVVDAAVLDLPSEPHVHDGAARAEK
jgi:hypothetical protein